MQGSPGLYECNRGHRWHVESSHRHYVCGFSKGDDHERCHFCWLADPPPPGLEQEWRTHPTESSVRQSFMTHRTARHRSATVCRRCHKTKQHRDWTLLFSQICSDCSASKRRCSCCGARLLSDELRCFCCRNDVTSRSSHAASAPRVGAGAMAPSAPTQRSDEHASASSAWMPIPLPPSPISFPVASLAASPAASSAAFSAGPSLAASQTALPAALRSVQSSTSISAWRHCDTNSQRWLIPFLTSVLSLLSASVQARGFARPRCRWL